MPVYIFVSPSIILKKNKIYFLTDINDFCDDFEKNTYYIDFAEIDNKGSFTYKNIKVEYEIITPTENKNLFVKFDYDDEFTDIDISEFIYSFEKFIFGINNDFTKNIETFHGNIKKIKYIRL